MAAFPYELGATRKICGKPEQYKGWTVWHYKLHCQQTGAAKGEWRDMALAVRGNEVLTGCVYQQIDNEFKEH